nr:SAHS [Hypsibius exemplaris]
MDLYIVAALVVTIAAQVPLYTLSKQSNVKKLNETADQSVQEKPWLGTWVSTDRIENWDAFVKAIGSDFPSNFKEKHLKSMTIKFSKLSDVDDKYRHELIVLPEETRFSGVVEFKLGGEEVKYTKDGMDRFLKYNEDSDGKLNMEIRVPGKNKVIHSVFRVVGDQLEKVRYTLFDSGYRYVVQSRMER